MPNRGSKSADKAQSDIERRLREIYQDAQNELIEKLNKHTRAFGAKDRAMRKRLEEGSITQAQYNSFIKGQMFMGEQWKKRINSLSSTVLHANEQANAIIEGKRRAVFGDNYLYQAKQLVRDLERDIDTNMGVSFEVYDSATVTRLLKEQPELLPRRKSNRRAADGWNRKLISNAITQGIIQGDSVPEIAQRIAHKTAMSNMKAAVRYARTAMTGAQNAGRMEMLHEAQEMGIKVKKVWLATLDERTRDAHAALDGQEQDVDKPFESPLGKIMYPGDLSANPANTWNCRCTLIYKYDSYGTLNANGVLLKVKTQESFENAARYDQENRKVIKYKKYSEWRGWSNMNVIQNEPQNGQDDVQEFAESYQYHATKRSSLQGIIEKGLIPNRGHLGNGIYFADSPEEAKEWTSTTSTGGTTILRVPEEYLKKGKFEKYSSTESGYGIAESFYNDKIPMEMIEIKVNDNGDEDDWWALSEYAANNKSIYSKLSPAVRKRVDKANDEIFERVLKKKEDIEKQQKVLKNELKNDIINSRSQPLDLQLFGEQDLSKQTSNSLKKGIEALNEQIENHRKKLAHPETYIDGWNKMSNEQRSGIKKHWAKEIRNFSESINNREDELRRREQDG